MFGRLRGLDAAAAAQVLASSNAQQAVRTSLIASVVNAEIALQSDAALRRISQDTLTSREGFAAPHAPAFRARVASELDLRAAESLLEARAWPWRRCGASRRSTRTRWCCWSAAPCRPTCHPLGPARRPGPADRAACRHRQQRAAAPPRPAPARSPAAGRRRQHRRRPRRLHPRITLTGSVGRASGDLSDLFKHSAWSFAPQLVMPLFDAGRNRANLAQVRAARETALAQYERASRPPSARSPTPWLPAACWPSNARPSSPQLSAERRRVTLAQARFDAGVASSSTCLTPSARPSPPNRRWSRRRACRRKTWWVCGGRWAVTRAMAPSAEPGDRSGPRTRHRRRRPARPPRPVRLRRRPVALPSGAAGWSAAGVWSSRP